MNAQHTPGPWSVYFGDSPRLFVGIMDEFDICELAPQEDEGEKEANARLIASAPDMLEALMECITSEGAACFGDMKNHPERMQARLYAISDIARSVIAKAKGETR